MDVFLQSLLTLPVFFVGLLAFLLEHTVSGKTTQTNQHSQVCGLKRKSSYKCSPRLHLFTVLDTVKTVIL